MVVHRSQQGHLRIPRLRSVLLLSKSRRQVLEGANDRQVPGGDFPLVAKKRSWKQPACHEWCQANIQVPMASYRWETLRSVRRLRPNTEDRLTQGQKQDAASESLPSRKVTLLPCNLLDSSDHTYLLVCGHDPGRAACPLCLDFSLLYNRNNKSPFSRLVVRCC